MEDEKSFLDKMGLLVTSESVEIGETYPIYGMITKIISDVPGRVTIELNFNIQANLTVDDEQNIQTLKERSFEPGIFVSKIISNEPLVVQCDTIVFGKREDPVH